MRVYYFDAQGAVYNVRKFCTQEGERLCANCGCAAYALDSWLLSRCMPKAGALTHRRILLWCLA